MTCVRTGRHNSRPFFLLEKEMMYNIEPLQGIDFLQNFVIIFLIEFYYEMVVKPHNAH